MSCFASKKPLHPAKKVWIRLTAAVHKLRRSKPVATILPVRPSEPLFHVQHGKSHKRFHARKSSHQQSFAPVYIDELFSRDAAIHVEGEKTVKSESTFVGTSSSGDGEKVGGKMVKSEWAVVGTSSSKEGEKMAKSEWTVVGTSSSKEGEKMAKSEWTVVGTSSSKEGEKMAKSEWTVVGTSSSKEGEKMAKSEWTVVGTSSLKEGEKMCEKTVKSEWTSPKSEWTVVGTSSSNEGEKMCEKMVKSEWTSSSSKEGEMFGKRLTAMGTSPSRVVGDLGEVDLRAEMFIARFKDGMRMERQRSFGEYQEMLARGV